jgi:hypothetical protein
VVTAPKLKPAVRKSIAARISVTRAARITADLFSPKHVKLYTWRFSVKAGRSIVKLRLPHQVRRTGVYTMRWTARSGREAVSRKITIRLLGSHARVAQPVQVLLAGHAAAAVRGKFSGRKPRLVTAAGVEPTFDAAANRRTDVRVIVVDVDEFGNGLVRDLHTIFPAARILALASTPKLLAGSLKAGAAIALPSATPGTSVARVIQRLLGKPVTAAKPTTRPKRRTSSRARG